MCVIGHLLPACTIFKRYACSEIKYSIINTLLLWCRLLNRKYNAIRVQKSTNRFTFTNYVLPPWLSPAECPECHRTPTEGSHDRMPRMFCWGLQRRQVSKLLLFHVQYIAQYTKVLKNISDIFPTHFHWLCDILRTRLFLWKYLLSKCFL